LILKSFGEKKPNLQTPLKCCAIHLPSRSSFLQDFCSCAILQWVLYATFPISSTFFIDTVVSRKSSHQESKQRLIITAYALTPLCVSLLFVGIPFLHKALVTIGIATFLYSLFYGYRIILNQTILRSFFMTAATYVFYETLRNVFVYVIGF
jgi:hypothetical protein